MFASVFGYDCHDEKVLSFIKKLHPLLTKILFRSAMQSNFDWEVSKTGYCWNYYSPSGDKGTIDPKHLVLQKLAIKVFPKFLSLSKEMKLKVYTALACLYGLDGYGKEFHKSKFLLTYIPSDKAELLEVKLARKQGIKVFNLALVNDCKELATFMRGFK